MTGRQRLDAFANTGKAIWAVLALAGWVVYAPIMPWYMIVFCLVPLTLVTFVLSLVVVSFFASYFITPEEIEEISEADQAAKIEALAADMKSGKMPHGEIFERLREAGVVELKNVTDKSDKIVGRFMDGNIYEWVELESPITKKTERFVFYSASSDGYLPEEDGKTFANVNGVVYVHPA